MTLNCKGTLIELSTPKVMGILNITPDSFFDGGKYANSKDIISQVGKMLEEGATFIDIGAYSSRPGADDIPVTEELSRILPVVRSIVKRFPNVPLSIDTFRSEVAHACLAEGAALINDISAGAQDENMFKVVSKHKAPLIMMHMKGNPRNMLQKLTIPICWLTFCTIFQNVLQRPENTKYKILSSIPGSGSARPLNRTIHCCKS